MVTGKLKNVARIDFPEVPEDATSVIVFYEVEPPTGSLLSYSHTADPSPIELAGPMGDAILPIRNRSLYLQRIKGAQTVKSFLLRGHNAGAKSGKGAGQKVDS